MHEIKTIEFFDTASQDIGFAIVRADKEGVALALSLIKDGDIEVFLPVEECRSLITALNEAVEIADA